jgi:hypothetical protein
MANAIPERGPVESASENSCSGVRESDRRSWFVAYKLTKFLKERKQMM